jgi:hypothetical protein
MKLGLLCNITSLRYHVHPQPLIPLTVRMITAKPVFVVRHGLRRSIADSQLPGEPSEHRAQHNVDFGVSQWHANTLP